MTLRTAFALLLLLVHSVVVAQDSPYFPSAGRGALRQAILDLRNPAVVLSVAPEPGQEDLPTLADLRLNSGARIISAYATNGGSTPSDLTGELPNDVAGRRKEEAYRALRVIGGDAYFLNLPDVGIVERTEALERLWQRDTVLARSVRMIRLLRPDLIMVARDARIEQGDSVRWTVMRTLLLESIAVAADSTAFPAKGAGPWRVRRILEENPGASASPRIGRDRVHPVWKKTASQIAEEAGRQYASLRVHYPRRTMGGARTYRLLEQSRHRGAQRLLEGLPSLTRLLSTIRPEVTAACDHARDGNVQASLVAIVGAVHLIEQAVSTSRQGLTPLERRVLAQWKTGLEDLRCLLLEVEFPYSVSDSILAPIQLMFLRFSSPAKVRVKKGTEIIFPASMAGTWLINETEKYRFPFEAPAEFRIVTPDHLELNTPPSLGGLEASTMRTKFPFVIFHKDSVSTRDVAFQREVSLRISPPQTVELLTPVVRVTPGERLVVRLQNVSRETYRGTMSLGDSVVNEQQRKIALDRKDALVLDTLALAWADNVPDGDHLVGLRIGRGRPVAHFLARKFEAVADTSTAVGLVSGISSSPVEDALRRLHVPCVTLDSAGVAGEGLARLRRVVLDRDALLLRPDALSIASRLLQWVAAGGHLVMLSQSEAPAEAGELIGKIGFLGGTLRAPAAPVTADSTSAVCTSPNNLRTNDWNDWTIARARGTVRRGSGAEFTVHVRDGDSGAPLVASAAEGKGAITAVALDLLPQFQTVQVGAYRLLANLLAY